VASVNKRIEIESGPDDLGRYHYALLWENPEGRYEPAPSKQDGKPVGYRRAQHFHAALPPESEGWRRTDAEKEA